MNAPHGINLMWNTSLLLPGVLLAPVTLLAGPQTSLTVLLTLGFAGSAAAMYWVLRRWGVRTGPAALGGRCTGSRRRCWPPRSATIISSSRSCHR